MSSAKAADLRRFLRRHAKSNGIDAETLARMPLAGPRGLQPLELPGADAAALDRRVRACDRLTRAASEHKVRIKDLVRQLLPMTPLTGDLGNAGLAILEQFASPQALMAAGLAELTRLISTTSNKQQGQDRARQWRAAAAAAIELYGDDPAVPFGELAAEVATEVRLLRAIQAELAAHAAAREKHYLQVDPGQLARTLPGFAEISAPVLVAVMGRPGRFRDGTRFRSYAGLAPRASQTGETDRKGQPMSKASPSRHSKPGRSSRRNGPSPKRPASGAAARSWVGGPLRRPQPGRTGEATLPAPDRRAPAPRPSTSLPPARPDLVTPGHRPARRPPAAGRRQHARTSPAQAQQPGTPGPSGLTQQHP